MYSTSWETRLRATGRHLPYGITVLPATCHKWTRTALTPARQASTRFTYHGGMEGWVDLGSLIAARLGSNPQPPDRKSDVLTVAPPSHPVKTSYVLCYVCAYFYLSLFCSIVAMGGHQAGHCHASVFVWLFVSLMGNKDFHSAIA